MIRCFTKLSGCLLVLIFLLMCISSLNGQITLSGFVKDANDLPLVNVPIVLEGSVQAVTATNEDGYYAFQVTTGGNYTIYPFFTGTIADYLNGVSTFDFVLLGRHLSGEQSLSNPYSLIAADVDKSGVIDSLDLDLIRLLTLRVIEAFPNNTPWRFVPADFEFPNPANPFASNFPESIQINSATLDRQDLDFVGIKIGDLNNSAFQQLQNNIPTAIVSGKVFGDFSQDCALNENERGLANWIVKASGTVSTYQSTSADGSFNLFLPIGDYVLSIEPTNNYWEPCSNNIPLHIQDLTLIRQNFAIRPKVSCPFLEVNLSNARLRRCFNNTYYVQYCNSGTTTAEDAYIEVELDPFLLFKSSSIPGTLVRDHVYRFDLGSVGVGVCQTFTFVAEVSCEAALGQTHCVEANIYPHNSCSTPNSAWDGASLEVQGSCNNDTVQFQIKNVGANMSASTRSIVIEDDLVMMQRSIQLNAGATETIAFPANGRTRYLQVTEPKGHPFSTFASVAVEGCGMGNDGTVTYGVVNNYPQADEAPFKDIECQDNRGAFDPNDKQAVPAGITENHMIEANTGLDYLIRFQNTGTDTAFTVVVRDTLSEKLNPASIVPGASSHPYKYYLENNVLTFLFSNIELPDSNVNEAASHGFIKFKIQQIPDLPDGTLIENKAGIYFDFNTPVITNTVWHTIGKAYFNIISSVENLSPNLDVTVAPNPFRDVARIELNCKDFIQGTFRLYDAYGRLVRTQAIQNKVFDFHSNGLIAGFYTFEILLNKQRVSVGKLMIQR